MRTVWPRRAATGLNKDPGKTGRDPRSAEGPRTGWAAAHASSVLGQKPVHRKTNSSLFTGASLPLWTNRGR